MNKGNIRRSLLALLLAAALLAGLFPAGCAEAPKAENLAENVTFETELDVENVTISEPEEDPDTEPADGPAAAPETEQTEETAEEPENDPEEETDADIVETDPPVIPETEETEYTEPSDEPEEDEAAGTGEEQTETEDGEELFEFEDEELYEFDDDDAGSISSELLEQFNNPETFERIEFSGTADIRLKEESFSYGQMVTLQAMVSGVEINCRLVWEANDGDERGWYTVASGLEYSFTVTPDNIDRQYRVVLFSVD